ncbi:colanic acid/amylovoran biosynthesis glycosyltransferase [uncultured bacterium]|nr:colanic acid/amylovoran biosynthesis glycosyltransferase [uncultured bacterium]
MRIAFIVSTFPKLSETFILSQITGLLDMGHDVRVFSEYRNIKEDKVHPDVLKYRLMDRTRYFITPENWLERAASAGRLMARNFSTGPVELLKSVNFLRLGKKALSLKVLHLTAPMIGSRFDIVHSHFGINGALAIYLKLMGVPGRYLTTFHGYDVNSLPHKAPPGYYRELFTHGDRFTSNTDYTRKRAVALGCDEKKITILPVGLDIAKFVFRPRQLAPREPVRLLTIGRLVEKKGHEYALKAVKVLSDKGFNIRYSIAGDGPEKNRLQGLASSLGLSKKVEFLHDINEQEALELYSNCHIFVLPSVTSADQDREGQALVLQEAQATGMPVVSTRHNGIPEGVLDGVSAFLVPERDHRRLAEKIEYLIERPTCWPVMGEAGRKFVEGKYDIRKLNAELVSIYEEMLRE